MARLFTQSSNNLSSAHNTALNITGDITILLWMTRSTLAGGCLVAKTNRTSIYDYDLYIVPDTGGNTLRFYSDATTPTEVSGPAIGDTNIWHRIAVRRIGTAVDFFVDGVKTAASGTMSGAFAANTQPFYVGSDNTSNLGYDGALAQVRVYNVGLTDDGIESVLRGVPIQWGNCVRAFDGFGVSSPEPDTSISAAHATVTGTTRIDHPPGISAVWLAPNPQWWTQAAGGTANPLSLSGSLTGSGSLVRGANKPFAGVI